MKRRAGNERLADGGADHDGEPGEAQGAGGPLHQPGAGSLAIYPSEDNVVASEPEMEHSDLELADLEEHLPPWTRELLACLTPRRRMAFVLREALGLTFSETGARLGVSASRARQLYEPAVRMITSAARRAALLTRYVGDVAPVPRSGDEFDELALLAADGAGRSALDMPIYALPLGVRAANCLQLHGVRTVGDLVAKTEEELLKIPGFGRKTLREVMEMLAATGFQLAMRVDGDAGLAEPS